MDLRAQTATHDDLLARRLDRLIPMLMERADLDAWVLSAREYNEDPVLATMLPAEWLKTARRRTILVFLRDGDSVARRAVARYPVGEAFPSSWDPESEPDQWKCLATLLDEADPARIGINTLTTFALADGLSATERDAMLAALPERLRDRVVSAEAAAIGWLETRLPEEMHALAEGCAIAHDFLHRALSPEVIIPGTTTTRDVEWWLRQVVHDAGYGSWFHPSCSVQRRGGTHREGFAGKPADTVITHGDLVHIDFGIVRTGLCTDQQQHAYALHPGETGPPAGLVAGLAAANRLQDLLMAQFATGRIGNEVLAATRAAAQADGIDGLIYTHPIGVHGHAAGATIGLWDRQEAIPGDGNYPLFPNTAWSIELQARVRVEEWSDQVVQFMLEEDAWFDGDRCRFLDGRQTALWVV
ncbi:MAG: M24 family metallopeptidase [Acidimicrobiia bacterium]